MDPFLEIFQELLQQETPPHEALLAVLALVQTAENRSMLITLAETEQGRRLLAEWRGLWRAYGVPAPWEQVLDGRTP